MAEVEYVYERPKEDLPKQKKSHKKLIIAVIAIAVILVAAYLLYTFSPLAAYVQAANEFNDLTDEAGESIAQTNKMMMQQFSIQSIVYNGDTISVSIRNVGDNEIDVGLISAFIDNSNKNIVGNTGTIMPGEIASFDVTGVLDSCDKVLSLRLPSGITDSSLIICGA